VIKNKDTMENLFKVGNIISTNDSNAFEILGENEYSVCVRDLLTQDFSVMDKTEHTYTLFNPKMVLKNVLKEILEDTEAEISKKDKDFIFDAMSVRIDKFLTM